MRGTVAVIRDITGSEGRIDYRFLTLQSDDGLVFKAPYRRVRVCFNIGDHIEVRTGCHAGVRGMVLAQELQFGFLTFVENGTFETVCGHSSLYLTSPHHPSFRLLSRPHFARIAVPTDFFTIRVHRIPPQL